MAQLEAGSPFVYVLVHPRQWQVDRAGNLAENVLRLREGITYAARKRLAARGSAK